MRARPPADGEASDASTFLGPPLGCAMAVASIDEMRRRRLAERAAALGAWWKAELGRRFGDHPRVAEVRGLGLMIGIELVKDRRRLAPDARLTGRVIARALGRGLIVRSAGPGRNVRSLTPPLTITRRELSDASMILKEALDGA